MTISLAIYQNVQLGQDAAALPLLFVSIGDRFRYGSVRADIAKRRRAPMSLRLRPGPAFAPGFLLEIDATFDRPITGDFRSFRRGENFAPGTDRRSAPAGRRNACNWTKRSSSIATRRCISRRGLRRIGYVPQDLALFPHLNVRANLIYGYRQPRRPNGLFTLEHVIEVMEIAPAARTRCHHPFRRRTTTRRLRPRHPFRSRACSSWTNR